MHHLCKNPRWCTYLKVKNDHPEWGDEAITISAAEMSSRPFAGKNMSLSNEGIHVITKEIKHNSICYPLTI
jgi:hypothetical protein